MEFYPDTRTDPDIAPTPTTFKAMIPTIKLENFCDASILANGIVTLASGISIPDPIEYIVGSGGPAFYEGR